MRALDAAMYPHIVDEVFAFADASSLLRLRTTNSAWRERANALLSTHLQFFASGVVGAVVHGDTVRHPGFHTFPEGTPFDWTGAMDAHRVADIVEWGEIDKYTTPAGFFNHAPGVMRMWENDIYERNRDETYPVTRYAEAETIVVFARPQAPFAEPPCGYCDESLRTEDALDPSVSVKPGTDEDGKPCSNRYYRTTRSLEADRTSLAYPLAGTRKVVFNLSLASGYLSDIVFPEPWFIQECETLEEVVHVFAITESHIERARRKRGRYSQLPGRVWSMLFNMLRGLDLKYTVVNASAFPVNLLQFVLPEALKDSMPKTWEAFHKATSLQECAEVFFHECCKWTYEIPEIEWLSYEEYEARVGRDTFRLETKEHPWAPRGVKGLRKSRGERSRTSCVCGCGASRAYEE